MKEFLHRHGIEFSEVDVATLADPWDTIRRHTGGAVGTPAVIIGTDAHVGYDPEWMRNRLDIDAVSEGSGDGSGR